MTDGGLQRAIATVQYGASERERQAALRLALAELAHRGHFDHLGIRYTVGKDGGFHLGLPWDAPGGPARDRGGA